MPTAESRAAGLEIAPGAPPLAADRGGEPRLEGLPLVAAHALTRLGPRGDGRGLWRYAAAIPVEPSHAMRLSLGEGATPMISAADPALPDVRLKLEFLSPTGSFKDRGAVVLVASALSRGASALIADSSGNAGSAIAAYAARAGLPCQVFVPAATSAGKRAQIAAYGAELVLVEGDRTATADAARAAVRERGAFYASHVYDPYFLQGTKTFAFEVWEQLGGAPDAVVLPCGNGTLVLGAAIGFQELHAAGLIDRLPALIAVQSAACAPLAQAWSEGTEKPAAIAAERTMAEGIAIPHPARGAEILAAVRSSSGVILTVTEEEIAAAARDLARRGLLVEPTGAVPWAAVLAGRGSAPRDAWEWQRTRDLLSGTAIVPLCGSGLKSPVAAMG